MEREKFKALTPRQKAAHLWEYYRWPALAVLLVLLLLLPWIHSAMTEQEPLLTVTMVNSYSKSPDGESFRDFLGERYFDGAVVLDKNIYITNAQDAQLLFCAISAGETDLFFWDNRQVQPALSHGELRDLRTLLPEPLLEAHAQDLVLCEDPETGEPYPCGIWLDHNPWITDNMYYVNCSAGIPYSRHEPQLAAEFLAYLLDQ